MDKTLTKESCWTEEDCLKATPRQEVIDVINELYNKSNIIIIWTARREFLRVATEYWLKRNGVFYHAIDMGHKMGSHCYIDDKAINSLNVEEMKKGIERVLSYEQEGTP